MNGRKVNDVDIEKQVDRNGEEHVYESYEPTTNELDDDNPPAEDAESSDSNSG